MPAANRVLLISDEENLRYTLKRIFEQDGFQVECASELCQDVLRTLVPQVDFIVLDTDLALQACEQMLGTLDLAELSVPVLVLTGAMPILAAKLLERSGLVIRQKPMEPRAILDTVRAQLLHPPA